MVHATKVYSFFESGVREPREATLSDLAPDETTSPLAHPSDRLLIQLNPAWRVADDGRQYILERRKGSARTKATGWVSKYFCRNRDALLRSICECGSVDEAAFQAVRLLPVWYVDRA
jgi:hypothetical protein